MDKPINPAFSTALPFEVTLVDWWHQLLNHHSSLARGVDALDALVKHILPIAEKDLEALLGVAFRILLQEAIAALQGAGKPVVVPTDKEFTSAD